MTLNDKSGLSLARFFVPYLFRKFRKRKNQQEAETLIL
nr:MAG TPA: hypothetical protein [Caudoviricetes sp.]